MRDRSAAGSRTRSFIPRIGRMTRGVAVSSLRIVGVSRSTDVNQAEGVR